MGPVCFHFSAVSLLAEYKGMGTSEKRNKRERKSDHDMDVVEYGADGTGSAMQRLQWVIHSFV